ncbi:carboxypeptidase B-like [Phlebotomus argentipes]|uniref:carboxypeptidase B-like n=1 Tax=Phlebotomus argentipes TaxID=94469 RepID=UPI0028936623|nr:carboxypeptidase B-like [Phlebotomus argentipes]
MRYLVIFVTFFIFSVVVVVADGRKISMQRETYTIKRRAPSETTVNFSYYWQPDEINQYLRNLAAKYPNLVTLEMAGKSYEGRDILVVRISTTNFDGTKPKIFIDAGIHAREWIAPMAALNIIHELVEHSADHADFLACDWIVIPSVNPDGYQFSHDKTICDQVRMWRKTRSINAGSECKGVDGNRNYDYNWAFNSGNSDDPCSDTFRGPKPHSEPEVQAVAKELARDAAGIRLYLSLHASGNYILFPWGYDRVHHTNHNELEKLGHLVADAIYATHKRRFQVGTAAILLYPAAGGSDDYAIGVHNISLSYTLELTGGGEEGFDLPANQIVAVSQEIFTGIRVFANYIASKS